MFLVAGLAVAGVAGILAAIYFSVRAGKRGGKRLRPAGPGRIGADRTGASRAGASRTGASRAGAVRRPGGRAALVRTGGQTEFALRASGPTRSAPGPGRPAADLRPARAQAGALTESWPAAPSDLDDPQSGDAWPGDSTATDPGLRAARPGADLDAPGPAKPGPGASRDARSRRRGFRKGADIDEELWPAESFGGVSDEQFWDDLASDKPLTTTARTAQQDAGPRSRLLDTGSDTDPQGTQALGGDRSGPGQARSDRSRTDRSRTDQGRADQGRAAGEGRRSAGYGAYPGPRTGTDPAAERTVVQPAYAATQPVKSMTPPSAPVAPKPFPGAPQPVKSTAPPPGATQLVRAASSTGPSSTGPSSTGPSSTGPSSTGPSGTGSAGTGPAGTGPSGTAGQPRGASAPPAETGRRRRPSGPDEDPLTSASFSLRQRGPVDGRSSLRSRDQQDAPRDRDAAGGPGRGPAAGPYGHTTPYSPAPAGTSYDDASSVTQMMSTPPYGEKYGSGSQADHAGRRNGTRSHARPAGADTGERPRPTRPAYPQDVRQASGSYPAGAYPGNGHQGHGHQPGGYPGNSYPGNGYAGNGYPGSGQPDGGHQGSGYPDSGHQGGSNPGNGSRGHGHRAPHDPRDDYRRLTHRRLPSRLRSCPKETWSGRPPAACTRRWRDGR